MFILFIPSSYHLFCYFGRFVPIAPSGGHCYDYLKEKCVGGIARVATIIRQLKQARPNAILLNAGDSFQGTLYYDIHHGNITSYFMNQLPHDATVCVLFYMCIYFTLVTVK